MAAGGFFMLHYSDLETTRESMALQDFGNIKNKHIFNMVCRCFVWYLNADFRLSTLRCP